MTSRFANRGPRTVTLSGADQQLLAVLMYESVLAAMLANETDLITDLIVLTGSLLGEEDAPPDIRAMIAKAQALQASRN